MVMRSGTTDGRSASKCGAGGRHRAPLLRKSRKSVNIHTNSGFTWGIPVNMTLGYDSGFVPGAGVSCEFAG